MKNYWILFSGFLLLAGCSGMRSVSGANTDPAVDGFWCDLSGTPVTSERQAIALHELPAYPRHCLPGDSQVPTVNACLIDAVCYQLDTGSWCAGGQAP